MRTWLLVLAACSLAGKREPIAWAPSTEIADGGGTKGPWQQNNSNFDYVDDPTVALDPRGDALVAWVDHRAKDVFVQRVGARGPRDAAVNVSRTPAVFSWLPRIVISPRDPQHVFVLWQEIVFSGGSHGGDIFFARSLDGGKTFEAPLDLSQSQAGDGKARIDAKRWHNGSLDLAADAAGVLYAAWTNYEGTLWFTRSTDDGEAFAAPLAIVDDAARPARAPALAIGGGTVYLAWTVGEDAAADIHLATSRDGGASFTPAAIVARTPGYSDAPKLAVDAKGVLHLAYAESRGGPFDRASVRYLRSRDHGRTFDKPRELSAPLKAASAAFPMLALDGDHVAVTWEVYPQLEHPRGLGLALSTDGGATFTAPAMIPSSRDAGDNGSHQGRLMRKLDVSDQSIAVVNSALQPGVRSRVWLMRGRWR